MYFLLGAEFIAAAQLVVYAGAIMVLFVFVIMLLNAGSEGPTDPRLARQSGRHPAAGRLHRPDRIHDPAACSPKRKASPLADSLMAGAGDIGKLLFTDYLLPFEATSILILIAILGAIVLARKEID